MASSSTAPGDPSSFGTTTGASTSFFTSNKNRLKVVFIHLDLGIGGAEQLVLQLATASQDLGYEVDLVTTRCDSDHCFAAVQKPEGRLSNHVYMYGRWIPPNVLGVATAVCSTLRMLYLTYQVTRHHRHADVVVVDVLPTSLPLLLSLFPSAGIMFYCHFPDKLLLRSNNGGRLKQLYRKCLDALEESTMGMADTLVVNSNFTLQTVQRTFSSLHSHNLGVLYPALDTSNMTQPNQEPKTRQSPIVSLNRFERKKNIQLLIHAYAYLQKTYYPNQKMMPPLIIAGGYDTKNVENVEYRGELQRLVEELKVTVDFRLDITDPERATLFQRALCVVYTPDKEHFGIVPLEAMYAGTPVLAVNSGGPMETVNDGTTGFLREPTPEAFGEALLELVKDPKKATTMGRAGRTHVEETFGTKRLEAEWKEWMEETKRRQQNRPAGLTLWRNTTVYFIEAVLALGLVLFLTWVLRLLGILGSSQSIFGAMRAGVWGDEL
jgi:alpha-1,3/alpha-1,6-mannosyltransferase